MTTFLKKNNNAKTTLNGAITTGTSIVVTSASLFPASGNFLCTIWDKTTYPDPSDDSSMEIVLVTGVSGSTFTVTRGQEGTTNVSHASGSAIEMLITKGHFEEIETDINTKQSSITTGTIAQYFRGNLSLATFPTDNTSFTNGAGYLTGTKADSVSNSDGTLTISPTTGAVIASLNIARPVNGGFGKSMLRTDIATTGTINNQALATGWINFTGSSAVSLTGIDATGITDGMEIIVTNSTTTNLTLLNGNVGSSAANRFTLGTNQVIQQRGSVRLRYNGTTSLWTMANPGIPSYTSPISINTSNAVSMTPASVANQGYVTLSTQEFGGLKQFGSGIQVSSIFRYSTALLGIDVANSVLYGADGSSISADWETRALYDSTPLVALNWGSRGLYDALTLPSMDWNSRILTANDGATTVMNWSSATTLTISAQLSVWAIYNAGGASTVYIGGAILQDTGGSFFTSLDASLRQLYANDGSTVVMNWSGTTALNLYVDTFTTGAFSGLTIAGATFASQFGTTWGTTDGAGNFTFSGSVGIGVAPGAKLHVENTTEQLRLGYDASNYFTTTVSSAGLVTLNAVGASSAFTFSDPVTATQLTSSGLTAGRVTFAGTAGILVDDADLTFATDTLTATKLTTTFIALPTTTSTAGQITLDGTRLLHTYGTGASGNLFLGSGAGNFTMSGGNQNNTGLGFGTLSALTSGEYNTAVGYNALNAITTGGQNTAIGWNAMLDASGLGGSALGVFALWNSSGQENIGFGIYAGIGIAGNQNLAIGYATLASGASSGNFNTAIGKLSGYAHSSGTGNVMIGNESGYTGNTNPLTTGSYNVFLGYNTGLGSSTQTDNSVAIGKNAQVLTSNTAVIGNTGSEGIVLKVTAGQSTARANIGGVIFDHYVDAGNTGTGEDDLYSDTLAASTLIANGDKVTATYQGIFVGAAASTQQLRLRFGGTLIYDSGALSIGVATNAWTAEVTCIRVSSSVVRCSVAISTDFATFFPYSAYTEVTGLTLTNTQILKVTGEAAGVGAANNQIVAKLSYGEWKPAA